MDSAGYGTFEPKTKLFPEVTATGRRPTHASSLNHENFDPVGVLCVCFAQNIIIQTFGRVPKVS